MPAKTVAAKPLIVESIHLEYKDGSSDKEYNAWISQDGVEYRVDASYGRRGSATNMATKGKFTDLGKARKAYTSLVNSKIAKGYAQPTGTATTATVLTGATTPAKSRPVVIKIPQLSNAIMDEADLPEYFDNPMWWMQEKMDGERRIMEKKGFTIKSFNRKRQEVPYPAVFDDLQAVDGDFRIDCEMIGDKLYVFDMLNRQGVDVASQDFGGRMTYVKQFLHDNASLSHFLCGVRTASTGGSKTALFNTIKNEGGEGVVFKENVPYTSSRPASGGPSMKFKFWETASFVVNKMNALRSVGLMLFDKKGKEVDAGNVSIPPNHLIPPLNAIIEVRYLYAFKASGIVYQPVYLGQRADIGEKECTTDQLKYKQE